MGGSEQQFCLKWNNHRSTLFSVFDSLLEEESLVDVTLSVPDSRGSPDMQLIKAHRVILSACSPYFRMLFRSALLTDKLHQVIVLKDVDFDNLKSLVEYMYKGEANVPQHMLASFIRDAESLQIRGLAECATKQLESEGMCDTAGSHRSTPTPILPSASTSGSTGVNPPPPSMPLPIQMPLPIPQHQSTPLNASLPNVPPPQNLVDGGGTPKKRSTPAPSVAGAAAAQAAHQAAAAVQAAGGPGGILAARLANPSLFNFPPGLLLGKPPPALNSLAFPGLASQPQPPPPMKKSRKLASDPKPSPFPPLTSSAFVATPPPSTTPLAAAAAAAAAAVLSSSFQGSPKMSASLSDSFGGGVVCGRKRSNKESSAASAASATSSNNNNNNNYESDEGVLKIDEEADPGKENRSVVAAAASPLAQTALKSVADDDIAADLDASNGISTDDEDEVEEPSMPGPCGELPPAEVTAQRGVVVNPWTGEPMQLPEDQETGKPDDGSSPKFSLFDASLKSTDTSWGSNLNTSIDGNDNGAAGQSDRDPATNKYSCMRCGRNYLHQATLVRHQRYECGISASYPCPLCGRKFKRRDVLKGHMEKCASKSTQAAQAAAHAAAVAAVGAMPPSLSLIPATSIAQFTPPPPTSI